MRSDVRMLIKVGLLSFLNDIPARVPENFVVFMGACFQGGID